MDMTPHDRRVMDIRTLNELSHSHGSCIFLEVDPFLTDTPRSLPLVTRDDIRISRSTHDHGIPGEFLCTETYTPMRYDCQKNTHSPMAFLYRL